MMRPNPNHRDPLCIHQSLSRILGFPPDTEDAHGRTLIWAMAAAESGARIKRKGWSDSSYLIIRNGVPNAADGCFTVAPSLRRSALAQPGKKRLIHVRNGHASFGCGSMLFDEGSEPFGGWCIAGDGHSFQWAYEQMKSGKRVSRTSWPKGVFLCMAEGFEIERLKGGRSLSEGIQKKLAVDPKVTVLALVYEDMISELRDYPLSSFDWKLVDS
jgi:hypothetical protein